MANKAIIGLESWDKMQAQAMAIARAADAGGDVPEADYHLNFSSAAQLFGELTPMRLALLEALQRLGTVPIDTLANDLGRNSSEVQADVGTLIELGLVEKNSDGCVLVPWEEIQIRITLGGKAAA